MLGGERLSGTTLAHAKEMLRHRPRREKVEAMSLEVVLITGMSGSGKSVALHALEDAGFYCVDNLPPELLLHFVALEQAHHGNRVAIAIDVRSATALPQLPAQLQPLRRQGVVVHSLFLDATTGTLVRRFSETRRRHPLSRRRTAARGRKRMVEAIELERELLADLRDQSHVIDTSTIRPAQLQSYVKALLAAPDSAADAGVRVLRVSSTASRSMPTTCSTCACCPTRTTTPSCAPLPAATSRCRCSCASSPKCCRCSARSSSFLPAGCRCSSTTSAAT